MNMRTMAFAVALTLAQGAVLADGVTRSLEPVAGGCKVTLAWTFSGKVDSDLVIEECFAPGWSVDGSTVSFDDTIVSFESFDAKWISGPVARFAVLGKAGSISFIVRSESATSVSVKGEWQMYMDGSLRRGMVAGAEELSNLCASSGKQSSETSETSLVEVPVAIKSFKVLDASCIELTYGGLPKAGTLVVQGCEGLGKTWMEVKRAAVSTPDGTVTLEPKDCRFYRMKLLTEEK